MKVSKITLLTSIYPSPDALCGARGLSVGQASGVQPTGSPGSWPGPAKGAGNNGAAVSFPGLFTLELLNGKLGEMGQTGLWRVCWLVS